MLSCRRAVRSPCAGRAATVLHGVAHLSVVGQAGVQPAAGDAGSGAAALLLRPRAERRHRPHLRLQHGVDLHRPDAQQHQVRPEPHRGPLAVTSPQHHKHNITLLFNC